MIRHPTTLTEFWLHCRSVTTAAKPRVPNTSTPQLYKWTKPEPPFRPTPKVWSLPQRPNSPPTLTETPAEDPSKICAAPLPESLKKWARPVAPPSNSELSEMSVLDSDSRPSIVPPAARATSPPEALKKWARPVAPPPSSKPSETVLNSDSHPSIVPPAARAVPPPEALKKWSRPVAVPSDSKISETVLNLDSQPSIAPLAAQKVSQPTPFSPDSDHANSSPKLAETPAENPHRAIGTAPPPETLKKWSRPVAPPSDSKVSEIILNSDPQPSTAPLAAQKVSQPTPLSPNSDHATNFSPTLAETSVENPHRAIGTAPPPETLKKWSRPVAVPSDSKLSETILKSDSPRPSIAPLTGQNVSQPTPYSPDSDNANSSPTLAETPAGNPHRTISITPPSETLKKWSRPVTPPPNSTLSQKTIALNLNSQSSMVPIATQKVSQATPDSDHVDSSPTLAETPAEYSNRAIGAAPPPETLKKWSRPVAPPSNSIQSQVSALNSNSQPSTMPLAAQKVSHSTTMRPDSDSSPALAKTPAKNLHRAIGTAPLPETLKKWSRPVAVPSDSKLSETVLNSESQPSIAPLAAQKVSQPTQSSPDSNHANSSPTLAETPAENSHRAIGTAPPPETLKKWSQPVTPPSDSKVSEIVLNSDSQPSITPLAAQKVSQAMSLDSDHANSSPTLAETPAKNPSRAIGTAPPLETLKKWSRPVAVPSNSKLSEISVRYSDSKPSIAPLAAQKVSQATSLSPDSDHTNSSPTLVETSVENPSRAIGTAPPPESLNKWSRPVALLISALDSDPQSSTTPLAAQKVSQATSLSPDSDYANSSLTLAKTPAEHSSRAIDAAPPPESLKKWSRPVALLSNSKLFETSVLDSDSQPSRAPLAAQNVLQPTSLPPNSDHANSSPTLAETPAKNPSRAIRTAPPPETLKKWSRPVAHHSSSKLSKLPVLDSVSDHAKSSPTLAEISAERPSRAIGTAPPESPKRRSRPVAPPINIKVSQTSFLNSDSQLSRARPAWKFSQRQNNASQPTSLSPDQSFEKTPPIQDFGSFDSVDEFVDEPLRNNNRRNQKDYEGKGRERIASKALQQSANTPVPKKKASSVPKLIKARRMDIYIPSALSVAALATLLNVKLARLQQQMKRAGMESESSYDHVLTSDYAVLLAEEFGRNPIVDDEAAFDIHPPVAHPNPSSLPSRPPIVTIMGHVDHGKTTLLDTLRSASVAKGEAGGITQHIGAFSVPVNETESGLKSITFLDTPGHAAFTAMRARGANVTDIIVLVVAADDGIMPQTREVINLFKREDSQVSLVVAINKIDKPNVDLDSVKRALMVEGIQVEEFGGDIPAVHVSGLTGEGLPALLETLSLVAEMQDLRAEHTGSVYGHVLESNVQKGLGPVATILIRRGCLKVGTHILSGLSHAKVRRMNDSNGKVVKVAIPGMAVTVSGWKILPKAGDIVLDGSENDIKKAISNRARRQELEALHHDVDAINSRRQQDRDLRSTGEDEAPPAPVSSGPLELKLIIKADVSGSAEAVRDALHGIGNAFARAQVISTGVGEILESDVMMAKAANATIVGFSVTASRSVQKNASQIGVPVCTSDIIYRLVDDVRERVTALLPVIVETKVTGEATILQLFDIDMKQNQTAKIAGCRVTNGVIEKQKFARVLRNGNIIYDGTLSTMRHIKKEITEARKGTECGLGFGEFRDFEAGDLVQMYEKIEKPGVI